MGMAKKEMERQEEVRFRAIEVAIEAGVLERCEYHEDTVMSTGNDPRDAYRLANSKYAVGANDRRLYREFMDAIKQVIEESGDWCYSCAKWQEE